MTGAFVSADEAARVGLVNHVVAHEDLVIRSIELAAQVAPGAADMLELYRRGDDLSPAAALASEAAFSARRTYDLAAFASAGRAASARPRGSEDSTHTEGDER
jgi:enoyl-CoA hydratase/carnithine racemase